MIDDALGVFKSEEYSRFQFIQVLSNKLEKASHLLVKETNYMVKLQYLLEGQEHLQRWLWQMRKVSHTSQRT